MKGTGPSAGCSGPFCPRTDSSVLLGRRQSLQPTVAPPVDICMVAFFLLTLGPLLLRRRYPGQSRLERKCTGKGEAGAGEASGCFPSA